MRRAALLAVLAAVPVLTADERPAVKVKAGDRLYVLPNVPPYPGLVVPLSPTAEHAGRMGVLLKEGPKGRAALVRECDGVKAFGLRPANRLTVVTFAGGDRPVEVRVESGQSKGKTGYVHPDFVYPEFTRPKEPLDPKAYPEDRRRGLFDRYFLAYRRAFADARKKYDQNKDRAAYEEEAGKLFTRALDELIRTERVPEADWFKVVMTGLSDGWDPNAKNAKD